MNVELVMRSLDHWRSGRIAEWIETLDPDVEWDITAHPLPDWPKTGRGRDAFVHHVGEYVGGWTGYEPTVKEAIDAGDEVVLILFERARMRGSDTMLDRDLPTVWTVRDGRLALFRAFRTREDAIDAVWPHLFHASS
jgi:ketosteroid isomerase-like protein